jgi:hypothetical protein
VLPPHCAQTLMSGRHTHFQYCFPHGVSYLPGSCWQLRCGHVKAEAPKRASYMGCISSDVQECVRGAATAAAVMSPNPNV